MFVSALGAICPHDFVYVPALLAIIVVGGHVGGMLRAPLAQTTRGKD